MILPHIRGLPSGFGVPSSLHVRPVPCSAGARRKEQMQKTALSLLNGLRPDSRSVENLRRVRFALYLNHGDITLVHLALSDLNTVSPCSAPAWEGGQTTLGITQTAKVVGSEIGLLCWSFKFSNSQG